MHKKTNQNKQKASTKKSKKTNERKNPGSRGKGTGIFLVIYSFFPLLSVLL